MLAPAGLLLGGVLIGQALAQAPPVSFPLDYKSTLVKYAVVDRSDGVSRGLYASREAIEALKRDPRLRELPRGTLLVLDVHSAKVLGRDRKTRAFVSMSLLKRFVETGAVQYSFCVHPGRQSCAF
jgi:hypothetical protein